MNTVRSPGTPASAVLWRVAAAVLGGYAFCWGFIALGVAGLFALVEGQVEFGVKRGRRVVNVVSAA